MRVRLATGPVSWGVDFAGAPSNPPWRQVLDDIGRSGFRYIELGPVGYLPEDPQILRAELGRRELEAIGSFVFVPLHERRRLTGILAATRRTCSAIAAAGGRFLVVIDRVTAERAATAGRSDAARRLDPQDWRALVDGIRAIAAVAGEFGLRPVIHPHAGSFVEFEDEIEGLLAALPPEAVELCLDTGHCAYAGIDPVDLYGRYARRIPYLHLKDLDPDVHMRAVRGELGFWQAVTAGVFCPVGLGAVRFPALGRELERSGFDGWATVEQDRDAREPGPVLPDVVASRRYLESTVLAPRNARVP
ncbi:MAG: sugar phosphate isomerase/epimerase family protein [Solirubrobacteraceae bacterium]